MSRGMAGGWPTDGTDGTVGVEEEFFLVDPRTGAPVPTVESVVAGSAGRVAREFVQELVECSTPVCGDCGTELLAELIDMRAVIGRHAAASGSVIAGVGTHPFAAPEDLTLTDTDRYRTMSDHLPWTWREATTCGMHVHVGVSDREEAVAICDQLRSYLPVLLAMSVNSPLWRGQRTGLASVRTVLRRLQPRTGLPPVHGSWENFERRMRAFSASGVEDGSWIWWSVRPHTAYGTVEVRVFDTQSDVRNAHALAALTSALVDHLREGPEPIFAVDDEVLLEESFWNAMSAGVAGAHVLDGDPVRTQPLGESALQLVALLDERLEPEVAGRLRALAMSPEADLQLRDFARGGCTAAIRQAARRTTRSCIAAAATLPETALAP